MFNKFRLSSTGMSKSEISSENTYESTVSGKTTLFVEVERHEVSVSLRFREYLRPNERQTKIHQYSAGGAGKRSYTRDVLATVSRDALQQLIEHLQEGLKSK